MRKTFALGSLVLRSQPNMAAFLAVALIQLNAMGRKAHRIRPAERNSRCWRVRRYQSGSYPVTRAYQQAIGPLSYINDREISCHQSAKRSLKNRFNVYRRRRPSCANRHGSGSCETLTVKQFAAVQISAPPLQGIAADPRLVIGSTQEQASHHLCQPNRGVVDYVGDYP